ncbi:hypothetical protein [Marinobacter nauticus]|uniref:hypothetical protein n=1 Tax=Marinobacter nauticus TaxID=2743 RepID=UPI001C9950B4|nr:hypothetical protein [Marinobacter nauticus]MBY5961715.1 hypothetical protein [Marinobacter nauticus]
MAKLKQKQWLRITEAAKLLTDLNDNGSITEADILQFAMDNEITLSIRTTEPTTSTIWSADLCLMDRLTNEQLEKHLAELEKANRQMRRVMNSAVDGHAMTGLRCSREILPPAIWDINRFGSGEEFVTRLWNSLHKGEFDELYRLRPEQPKLTNNQGDELKFIDYIELVDPERSMIYSLPTHLIPHDSYLVVRRSELERLFEDEPSSTETKALSTKEEISLYRMVLGMAMAKYGYNPDSGRNKATGENDGSICADLERAGLSVDADTIRKHLNAALAVTPPEMN